MSSWFERANVVREATDLLNIPLELAGVFNPLDTARNARKVDLLVRDCPGDNRNVRIRGCISPPKKTNSKLYALK